MGLQGTVSVVYWLATTFYCIMSYDDSIKTRMQTPPYVRQTEARKDLVGLVIDLALIGLGSLLLRGV